MQPNLSQLPAGLVPYRKTPLFKAGAIPQALLGDHSTKAGVWGVLHVVTGTLRFRIADARREAVETLITAGDPPGLIEPEILHRVEPVGDAGFYVEFYRQPNLETEGTDR